MGIQNFQKGFYRGKSFFSDLWIRYSTPNGSGSAFSKSVQEK